MSSVQYIFATLNNFKVVVSKWFEQNIFGGQRLRGPRWKASTINDADKCIYNQFKTCIKEASVTGSCQEICRDLHSNVIENFEKKFKRIHNNKKIIKFITTNGYRPSAPTLTMKQRLDEDFHFQFNHMVHHETLIQLKQKTENIFHQYSNETDCDILVIAYMIINCHLHPKANLIHEDSFNQYHVEFMALQFVNPNYAIPLFLEPNGKYTRENNKSIQIIYNI